MHDVPEHTRMRAGLATWVRLEGFSISVRELRSMYDMNKMCEGHKRSEYSLLNHAREADSQAADIRMQ